MLGRSGNTQELPAQTTQRSVFHSVVGIQFEVLTRCQRDRDLTPKRAAPIGSRLWPTRWREQGHPLSLMFKRMCNDPDRAGRTNSLLVVRKRPQAGRGGGKTVTIDSERQKGLTQRPRP